MKPIQIINILKQKYANDLIIFCNNTIQLKNVGRVAGKDMDEAATKLHQVLCNLYTMPTDTDWKEESLNILTNWVCLFDKGSHLINLVYI